MNLNTYKEWRAVLDKHYGGLDKFDHAPTVRIMRNGLAEQLTEYEGWITAARKRDADDPDLFTNCYQELVDVFGEDVEYATAAVAELDAWLAKRNLTL